MKTKIAKAEEMIGAYLATAREASHRALTIVHWSLRAGSVEPGDAIQ